MVYDKMGQIVELRKITFQSKIFFLLSVCQILTGLCAIIMMFNDYRTPPMQCLLEPKMKAVETFCYIQSVFTLKGVEKLFPPLGNVVAGKTEPRYQRYFFWLPYLLWTQVLLLGVPHYLWKNSEGGFMGRLLQHMPQVPNAKEMESLANYIAATISHYKLYALKFLGCEMLGFIFLALNIFITDRYLEGRFFKEIPLIFYQLIFTDRQEGLLDEAFPKVAKCSFYLYGGSGTVMLQDTICIMSRNLLTGRIYMLLFSVYSSSAIIAAMSFAWRLISYISVNARIFNLFMKVPVCAKENMRYVMWYCDYGDWFVIQQMASLLINFNIFAEILRQKLHEKEEAETLNGIQQKAQDRIQAIYNP